MTEIKFRNLSRVLTYVDLANMERWCIHHFGPSKRDYMWRWVGGRWWLDGTYSFKFTHSEDAMMFMLKWG
jgi:hypothetical protein